MDWNWKRTGLPPHRLCPVLIFAVLLISWTSLLDLRCEAQKLAEDEVNALKIIGSKLKKDWNFTVDPCSGSKEWLGDLGPTVDSIIVNNVTCACNSTTNICHVTSILLRSQNLTGELPEEFADLPFLTDIDLTRNYLNGTIPPAWSKLPLVHLSLIANRVTGTIPEELGDMITLEEFLVEGNQLNGSIPATLGKLTNLRRIMASGNYLSGELPEALGNLKNLKDVMLDGNPISGKIPSFIGNWTNLDRLDLQGTAMEGPFPDSFSRLENITQLRVSDLKGGLGAFPPLQNMKKMKILTLRNLSIPGQLPDYIGEMGNLKSLDLSFNKLTGPIPASYDALTQSINYMYLTSNMLTGTIPSWITGSKQNFDMSYNSFNGSAVPSCQIASVNLVSSYSSTSSNTSMRSCLRRNLPCASKATNYKLFINCGGSKVKIDDIQYEEDSFSLGTSQYSASDIGNWAYSSTGNFIDSNTGYLATATKELNMTNSELYMNARLSPISLKYYGLCMMEGSYNVKLHFAEIMFTDDQTYASNGRRFFDVAIQGQKVLQDFNIAQEANGTGKAVVKEFEARVDGNGTLEIHFYWTGKGTLSVPFRGVYGPLVSAISVTPNFKVDTDKLSVGAIVGIVAAGCAMVLLIVAFLYYRKRRHDNELDGIELQAGQFSLKQIKAATNNFDYKNKIGEGGFGPVFKGVLPDGSEIAVKQLSSKSKQGNREFLNEIGVISAVQHPNLVKLFGCCIEGDQLLLVYEYMENNSLALALFALTGPESQHLHLDWEKRRAICLGIARGLAYLHEESRLKIVHRDIKATNILLDKNFNAKISDFGLAKLDEEENTHISTRIAGTIGYMAPEYAMRGYLTEKADVYSFGIVVLELVSGMSNTNFRPKEEFVYLLDWACVLHDKGRLLELVDPKLGSNFSKEEALLMLNLALSCTNISPTLRPSMTTAVSMLEGKTPLGELPARRTAPGPGVDELRFKAFENLTLDSQSESSIYTDGWANSSASTQATREDSTLL